MIDSKLATALARAFDFATASQLATATHKEKDTAIATATAAVTSFNFTAAVQSATAWQSEKNPELATATTAAAKAARASDYADASQLAATLHTERKLH